MSENYPIADWSRLRDEPDLAVPLPGGLKMLFRRIPAGSFMMGSRGERMDWEPRHRVIIPYDFYLGKYVVTQAEWRAVAGLSSQLKNSPGTDPSDWVNKGDRLPVTDIAGSDANAWSGVFALLLTAEVTVSQVLAPRLPTEVEWEYACRAGTETECYHGDGKAALAEVAWFDEHWGRGVHPVDERQEAHPAGLHGMHGNVWELCLEAALEYNYRRCVDGDVAPEVSVGGYFNQEDLLHEIRGGSYEYSSRMCHSAFRWTQPVYRNRGIGFRLCLAPGPKPEPAITETGDAAGAGASEIDLARERMPPDDAPSRARCNRDETRESPPVAEIPTAGRGAEKAAGGAAFAPRLPEGKRA